MIQFLVSVIEWIAVAGLAFLGVSYEAEAPCPTPTAEYSTVEYVVPTHASADFALASADLTLETASEAHLAVECVLQDAPHWVPATSGDVILIRT